MLPSATTATSYHNTSASHTHRRRVWLDVGRSLARVGLRRHKHPINCYDRPCSCVMCIAPPCERTTSVVHLFYRPAHQLLNTNASTTCFNEPASMQQLLHTA